VTLPLFFAYTRRVPSSLRAFFVLGGALASGACVHDGYPLGPNGSVDMRVDVADSLFAADTLGPDGMPTGTRQTPFSTGITLSMTENDAPAFGAFVYVRVEPPQALTLSSAQGETKGPTCAMKDGNFRCIATKEGIAKFVVSSESDWSGMATVTATWANLKSEKTITVLPAGLPANAANFELVGITPTDHVLATFKALTCTTMAVPDDLGSKWRDGQIRSRQVYVRATPPPNQPTAVENAPVFIESLSADAQLALDPTCADRATRIRMVLAASGQSDPFYICFSDIGGQMSFAVTSGINQVNPNPTIPVDPEPRLLRVGRIKATTMASVNPDDFFDVEAYDANRVRISMPVDLTATGGNVLQLDQITTTLADESSPPTIIRATPLNDGMSSLQVTPRLLSTPVCVSDPVTVAN
jgi:hypothetical protein